VTEHADVLVAIAAYREGAAVGDVVTGLRQRSWRVLVVDDGSDDNTAVRAAAAGAIVVRHPINLGQGAALRTAFRAAQELPGVRIVVTFDADGQHAHDAVEALVAPIRRGEADVTLGTRFSDQAPVTAMPWVRRLALRCVVAMMRRTTGLPLTDAHNGLRAISIDAVQRFRLVQDRMAHASEITREIARLRLRMVEVPVHITYTDYSLSKGQRLLDGVSILWDLFMSRAR